MKNEGFTLIELLAVIVVLAIIALIATPMILGVVEKARKGAAESSALGWIDSIEKYIILHDLNASEYPYELKNGTWNAAAANSNLENKSLNEIIFTKGELPKSGTITINNKGKVTDYSLVFGVYIVTPKNGNPSTAVATKISKSEQTGFTGTIYRNDSGKISLGDKVEVSGEKIAYDAVGWCAKNIADNVDLCNSMIEDDYIWDDNESCETELASAIENGEISEGQFSCYEKKKIEYPHVTSDSETGYSPYVTNPSEISTDYYLRHDIVNGVVKYTYVCGIENNTRFCIPIVSYATGEYEEIDGSSYPKIERNGKLFDDGLNIIKELFTDCDYGWTDDGVQRCRGTRVTEIYSNGGRAWAQVQTNSGTCWTNYDGANAQCS